MPVDTIQADDLDDLVKSTLKELGRGELIDVAQQTQSYEIWDYWFKKQKLTYGSGYGLQRNIFFGTASAARFTGLGEVDNVDIPNVLSQMTLPWRFATTNWAYALEEMMMNKGEARITNVISPRRKAAVLDLIEIVETKCWADAPSPTDNLLPYSIPYWVVKNSTTGYNGGAPSGHTTVAGVDPATVPAWKNWTAQYTNVTKSDLIALMREGYFYTKWKTPVGVEQFRTGAGKQCRYYMNYATLAQFEAIGESQNENLGRDVASMDGMMTFRGHPLVAVVKLDSDTQNPVYGIDHDEFKAVALQGDWMRETGPQQSPKQHNMREVHIDIAFNLACFNRRRQQVYATA